MSKFFPFDNLLSNLADLWQPINSFLLNLIAQGLNSQSFTGSPSQQTEAQQTEAQSSSPKEEIQETITFDSDSSSGSSTDE